MEPHFFFLVIYLHLLKGLYYKSYNKTLLWLTGFTLFVLTMVICFLGYVLPWGQMSYWGCMVITNTVTIFPYFGEYMLRCIWGGEIISEITLIRIYSVHFILPFILLTVALIHISILHIEGLTSPLGIENYDYILFYPYIVIKDIFFFCFFMLGFYIYFVFFNPNYLGECLNYTQVNYIKTPIHIVPEWYLLPYYGMLRCIFSKTGGILCTGFSLLIFALLVFLPVSKIPSKFDIYHKLFFFLFVLNVLILGWLATQLMSDYVIYYSWICTKLYFFFYFLFFINSIIENFLIDSINIKN